MEQTRASNYEALIAHFYAHTYDDAGSSMPRFAAVAEEFFDEQRVGAKIALCETEQQAFEFLGESILEGYAADGVYDLDSAEKIYIEVFGPSRDPRQGPGLQCESARRIAGQPFRRAAPDRGASRRIGGCRVKRLVKRIAPDGAELR